MKTPTQLAAIALAALAGGGCLAVSGAVLREEFAADPAGRGWQVHGDSTCFAWNAAAGRLGVTWDSTRTNSFFWHPLETVVARTDDCRFAFTLQLDDLQSDPGEGTFQLALGLLRREDAFATNAFRGAGVNPAWGVRNLLEFDYFPASDAITPTFSAVAVNRTNLRWAYVDVFPLELEIGQPYRVEIALVASNQTLRLTATRDGQLYGQGTTHLNASFDDFRVDAFSISSYSGSHQPAGYGGQIRAVGWVDDLEIEVPDPPASRLEIRSSPEGAMVATPVVPYWAPLLERSEDLVHWTWLDVPPLTSNATWTYRDPTPSAGAAAYRIQLVRP